MWKKRYINSSTSHSVPKDVPGSSSSESEDGNLDLSLGPATCLHAQDLSGSDSGPSVHWLLHEQEESDSLSDEDSSHHEDGGTDYVDSDLSDVEELLHSEDVKLLLPLPPRTRQQDTWIILIWLVYFVLVWQYKNYQHGNFADSLAIVQREVTLIATRSFRVVLENRGTTAALMTEIRRILL
ncbi:hypothetical protein ACROYT_G037033 [Oculina patagonica]